MNTFMSQKLMVASSKSTVDNGVFNPLTPPMNSTGLEDVRVTTFVQDRNNCGVRPGVIWSNDGIVWNPAFAETLGWNSGSATWITSNGWSRGNGFVALSSLTYEMLFIRFGVFARSTSGSIVRNANVQLQVDAVPVPGARTRTAGPLVIASPPSSGSSNFYAMTERISSQDVASVRVAWENAMETGTMETRPAYQTSDDGVTWSASVPLSGSWYGAIGYSVAGFQTVDLTNYLYVRFGMQIQTTGATRDFTQASLRVDTRAS